MNELLGNAGRTVTYGPSPRPRRGRAEPRARGARPRDRRGRGGARSSSSGATRRTPRPPTSSSRAASPRCRATRVRRPLRQRDGARSAGGSCPRRTSSRPGATRARSTARPSIAQPLMRPLVEGKTAGAGARRRSSATPGATSRELVAAHWNVACQGDLEACGRRRSCAASSTRRRDAGGRRRSSTGARSPASWRPPPRGRAAPRDRRSSRDAKVHDGRFGDNAWLQELRATPSPSSPGTTRRSCRPRRRRGSGSPTRTSSTLEVRGRRVRAPVLVVPGHGRRRRRARRSATGRRAPTIASRRGVGANAYAVRDSRAPWFDDAHRPQARASTGRSRSRRSTGRWRAARSSSAARSTSTGGPGLRAAAQDERRRSPLRAGARRARTSGAMTIDLNACTGLQRVRRRLPGGEQHPRRRQGRRRVGAARCTGSASTATSSATRDDPRVRRAADALPALREGALRVRLPGQRHRAQPRRPERDGLQPLRRHAVLLATTARTRSAASTGSTTTADKPDDARSSR